MDDQDPREELELRIERLEDELEELRRAWRERDVPESWSRETYCIQPPCLRARCRPDYCIQPPCRPARCEADYCIQPPCRPARCEQVYCIQPPCRPARCEPDHPRPGRETRRRGGWGYGGGNRFGDLGE